jgi:uncharacterized membrane protein YjgN (DUF898 family)
MKNYLNFTLTGSKLLPLWIALLFFFMVPYFLFISGLSELTNTTVQDEGPSKLFFLYLVIILAMLFTFIYFFAELVIRNMEFMGMKVVCDYQAGKYIGIIISGLVLTIVTIGIHIPWFIKNMYRFFVNGTSYNSNKFGFGGRGGKLFLIMTLTIFIPFLVTGFILFTLLNSEIDIWIYQLIVMFSLVPNIYLIYKWMVDIRYKDYLIWLETESFHAMGKIAIELAMAVITFGIYFPMAYLRLYRYFVEHTKSNVVDGRQISMGYDGDQVSDFLFIWGQIILTIVTLGVYYPWAFCRMANRVFSQTFVTTDLTGISNK